jgi:hypothetical protein
LVSNPPWTWAEIHSYYAKRLGLAPIVKEKPSYKRRFDHHIWQGVWSSLKNELIASVYRNRDFVDNILGKLGPRWQMRLRDIGSRQRVARAISEDPALRIWAPYEEHFVIPGQRLKNLSDSRSSMSTAVAEVQSILGRLGRL